VNYKSWWSGSRSRAPALASKAPSSTPSTTCLGKIAKFLEKNFKINFENASYFKNRKFKVLKY
jgi:hypothetical protein